jgi:hypothetical protein
VVSLTAGSALVPGVAKRHAAPSKRRRKESTLSKAGWSPIWPTSTSWSALTLRPGGPHGGDSRCRYRRHAHTRAYASSRHTLRLKEGRLMGLPLSEVRDVSCPLCGASPGWDCVRIDAQDGGGKKRARVHQRRVQAAGRMRARGGDGGGTRRSTREADHACHEPRRGSVRSSGVPDRPRRAGDVGTGGSVPLQAQSCGFGGIGPCARPDCSRVCLASSCVPFLSRCTVLAARWKRHLASSRGSQSTSAPRTSTSRMQAGRHDGGHRSDVSSQISARCSPPMGCGRSKPTSQNGPPTTNTSLGARSVSQANPAHLSSPAQGSSRFRSPGRSPFLGQRSGVTP